MMALIYAPVDILNAQNACDETISRLDEPCINAALALDALITLSTIRIFLQTKRKIGFVRGKFFLMIKRAASKTAAPSAILY